MTEAAEMKKVPIKLNFGGVSNCTGPTKEICVDKKHFLKKSYKKYFNKKPIN